LYLSCGDPELLRGENQANVAEHFKAAMQSEEEFTKLRMSFQIPWTVISVPTQAWASRVFPEMDADAAEGRLWGELMGFCRVGNNEAIERWRGHVEEIEEHKRTLNERDYRELRFTGPGTDLVVGLPEGHKWNGGQARTPDGTPFSPNIPTEEVFTMPHRDRVEGTVTATRPIHHEGLLIEDLKVTFEGGVAVKVSAAAGQEQIERIIAADEGAARLGEVALISHDSPIARSGRLYFNPLIDENAACHLAFGRAYRDCIEGGDRLSETEFEMAGGNVSSIHIDFMIGSGAMDVIGRLANGGQETVLKEGRWMLGHSA
ncbi:MAG TPA: aminopeptidase, partial [Spirochaetia bacterium]|nr:aminopeptidase [Spirochaetia bacterium]